MGDVNAVHTLVCALRRQLLAARALHERSPLIKGLPFPRTKNNLTRICRRSCNPERCAIFRRASKFIAHRCAASRCFARLPADAHECVQVRQYTLGRILGRTARWRFGHTQIPLWTPGLAHARHGADFCNGRKLDPSAAGCVFDLAFRREVFASLDVPYTAATSLPPSRRCRLNGAFFQWDKLAGRALRNTPRCRRISKRRWRLLRVHCTGGLARLVRCWPRRKGSMFALIGKAKIIRATCLMYVQLRRFLWSWSGPRCFRFFAGKRTNLLKL